MNRRELAIAALATTTAFATICAARSDTSQPTPEERAARQAEYVRMNGGILKIGGEGRVEVLHSLPPDMAKELDAPLAMLRKVLNVEMSLRRRDGGFSVAEAGRLAKEAGGNVTVFVVDDKSLPPTLVAPEERWAAVNVAALMQGAADDAARSRRLRMAFLRTACRVLGADASKFKTSCLFPAGSVSDLDRLEGGFITVDTMMSMLQYIERVGLKQYRLKTYRDACEDGEAPAPTNDVQRAVWEQVQADKERGPSNPITIQPPNQKK